MPGIDFALGFLKHQTALARRFSSNVKKVCSRVNSEVMAEYIEHLSKELEGIPPENIWNYDETNLTDDPSKKKVISRRGSKYVETICNSTKTSTTVRFCRNATGSVFLPPYVVFKAEHLWDSWCVNGAPKTRYSRKKEWLV